MIDERQVALHAQLIAIRHLMVKTFVKAFDDMPADVFGSMADAWVEQLSTETYPQLGAALSDHLAAEVQEVLKDVARQAKAFRAAFEEPAGELPE